MEANDRDSLEASGFRDSDAANFSELTDQDRATLERRHRPLRPIRDDADLEAAIQVINSLLDQKTMTGQEEAYLDKLATLVKQYESERHPM